MQPHRQIQFKPIIYQLPSKPNHNQTQMQVDNIKNKQYEGSWHCLSTLYRNHGASTLLTGTSATIIRDAFYLSAYFYVYEGMKATLTGRGFHNDNFFTVRPEFAVPIAGGCSGASAWLVSIPFDCVRAGVQSQNLDLTKQQRKSGQQVLAELLQTRGIRALYRGVTPTVMRAFIVSASRFSAYEVALGMMQPAHHFQS